MELRFLIGRIQHETNTFSNVLTDESSFRLWDWDIGEEVVRKNRGVHNFIGGMIDKAIEIGVEVTPVFSAYAYPSGIITAQTYETLKNTLINQIKKTKDYDAIILSLHGAGVSEAAEDFEGSILVEVQSIIEKHIPVIVTLDLHANMTEKIVRNADAILGNHLYPHTDCYEIGAEAVCIAKQIVEGQLKPTMHLAQLPMVIPTSTTNLSPAKDVNELCFDWESNEYVVDCTFYHGFPYTNSSSLGSSMLVTTNNNPELAERIANELSEFVWKKRHAFIVKPPSPEVGIQRALESEGQPVVINETSDNPGGGTPGDGTYLLQEMIYSQLTNACFAFIYDPESVQKCIGAGVGATAEIELGGKTDKFHGNPIKLKAYVKSITDGQFIQSSPMGKGARVHLGPSVRIQTNGIDIIVCSVKAQVLDEEIFLIHGIDIRKYKIVGLKSSQHFRAGFDSISSKIITVDSPGLSTMDFTVFDYTNLKTKLFPFHDISYSFNKSHV